MKNDKEEVGVLVRMPTRLRDKLRELAERNERTMSAQIRHMIEVESMKGHMLDLSDLV